jgi:hypothetical protein
MNIERLMRTDQLHPGLRLADVMHAESLAALAVRSLANTESVDGGFATLHSGGN